MNKKIVITTILLIILTAITIFIIFNYKNFKTGNTIINKSEGELVEYILGISSYKANIEIEVKTNKNSNKYKIIQEVGNGISVQEVIEPENIAGVKTKYDGKNLELTNPRLELNTVYENYSYMVNNKLWLDSFIKEYKEQENSKVNIKENEIILEVKNENGNKYNIYKKLYVDKNTGKPTKMIIQDINQNTIVYILYTEIEIS